MSYECLLSIWRARETTHLTLALDVYALGFQIESGRRDLIVLQMRRYPNEIEHPLTDRTMSQAT